MIGSVFFFFLLLLLVLCLALLETTQSAQKDTHGEICGCVTWFPKWPDAWLQLLMYPDISQAQKEAPAELTSLIKCHLPAQKAQRLLLVNLDLKSRCGEQGLFTTPTNKPLSYKSGSHTLLLWHLFSWNALFGGFKVCTVHPIGPRQLLAAFQAQNLAHLYSESTVLSDCSWAVMVPSPPMLPSELLNTKNFICLWELPSWMSIEIFVGASTRFPILSQRKLVWEVNAFQWQNLPWLQHIKINCVSGGIFFSFPCNNTN